MFQNSASSSDESDSDCYKEPASKYPRLSGREQRQRTYSSQPEDCDSSEVSGTDCLSKFQGIVRIHRGITIYLTTWYILKLDGDGKTEICNVGPVFYLCAKLKPNIEGIQWPFLF